MAEVLPDTLLHGQAEQVPQQPEGTMLQSSPPGPPPEATVHSMAVRLQNQPGGTIFPRIDGYEIDCELGHGGMGIVYKARQILANRVVALKTVSGHVDSEMRHRFLLEVQAIAELEHAHIVRVFDVGETDGKPYFAMEYCGGGSLASLINGTPWSSRSAAEMIVKLASGMALAHSHGLIHRDLKPANVLIGIDNLPKITDFGLAKRLDTDDGQTRTGMVMGTPCYMAPEQAEGRPEKIGPASDVYSLGAILYELLTGRPPFRGSTPMETLEQVRKLEPLTVRSLNPHAAKDLDTICQKCLSKEPSNRYANALELAEDLSRWLDHMPIQARPIGAIERFWRWVMRNPVTSGMMLASILGLVFTFVHLRDLSKELVRTSAVESALQQAYVIEEANEEYADIVVRAQAGPYPITLDYPPKPGAVPLSVPAAFIHDLSKRLSERKDIIGLRFRLYSDYPFPWRKDGGPQDEFERKALAFLRENPNETFHEFTEWEGQNVLRFAKARIMTEGCIDCHNKHTQTPKNDWKLGEVRGVLQIIRPLDKDVDRISAGFRMTTYLVSGLFFSLLAISLATMLLRRSKSRRSVLAN